MKRIFIIPVLATLFLSSCGADQATVDKMSGKMCEAMEAYDPEKPMTMLDVSKKLMDIANNKDEYGTVSESQLQSAMEKECPEGWTKFEELKKLGGQ